MIKYYLGAILGGISGIAIGSLMIFAMIGPACSKPERKEWIKIPQETKLEKKHKPISMDVDVKGNKVSVKIIEWDMDPDGLITAEWEYADGRRGGTDWTELKWMPELIEEQSHWRKCSKCDRVWTPDSEYKDCWRHRPIPEREEFDLRIPGTKPVIILETDHL